MKFFLFLCLFFCSTLPIIAQQDIEGSKDHPLLTRYPEAYIASYESNKYQEYTLSTGPVTGYRKIDKQQLLAGKVTRITYQINQSVDQLSIGEVFQDYQQALERAQVKILGAGLFPQRNVKKGIGGGSWIGVAMINNVFNGKSAANLLFKGTSTSGGTFSIIGQTKTAQQETYVAIYGERHSKDLVVCHLDIIEVKAAELGQVFADADFISQTIEATGSVSIYGILFDFNSSTIKAESDKAIQEIAKYLQGHPDIQLYVVGHTDMQGSYEYNLQLSQQRAQAIVDALVEKHQIQADRLSPYGVSFLAPKASNTSEEGRAINRRTELVKRWTLKK